MKRLIIELDDEEISYKNSSNLQGVLFEHISEQYADFLHMQQRHPYSQYLYKTQDKVFWCVNALDEEAGKEIIDPLLRDDFTEFSLKKQDRTIHILNKNIIETSQQELVKQFYSEAPQHLFRIEMITAASFKQRGKYIVLPDIRLFFQSLMNKYSAVSPDMELMDEDVLEMLTEKSEILQYRLRTVKFPVEGICIPGFIGDFLLKVSGADTMAAYAKMLLKFGEYAGVGVKTAMGMGAFRIVEGGKRIER